MRYKNDPDPRVRARFEWEVRSLKTIYGGLLWAMERQFRHTNRTVSDQIRLLREQLVEEFGLLPRLLTYTFGPLALWMSLREQRRLANGQTYEPKTFVERRHWAVS
jgi:hypothetical protein